MHASLPSPNGQPPHEPLAAGRREAAQMLGISERLLWTWTNSGEIPHVRIGTRVLYPVAQLRCWLSKKAGIAFGQPPINDPQT